LLQRVEENIATKVEPSGQRSAAYYPWFDWLRLALALLVLVSHQGLLRAWPDAANFAVQVFFALSGWLIGGLLLQLPKDALPRFYFNRALRIWCPYLLALALLVGASLLRDPVTSKWKEFVFYKVTFVYNLFGTPQLDRYKLQAPLSGTGNHFWSVNAEEQFYLLAPLLIVLLPRRYGRKVLTWIAIAALALISRTYASIAFGVLAAVIANRWEHFHRHVFARAGAAAALAISAAALVAGAEFDFAAPVCAVSIVLLFAIEGKRHRWGELAGGMSYPLYLNAWVAVFIVNAVFKRASLSNAFAHQAIIVASALGLAALLYWFFDRPILASRKRLYTRKRARILMGIAYGTVGIGVAGAVFFYHQR
jgi:peptidoglycan/LPS O-acetylase OafA/YrhL